MIPQTITVAARPASASQVMSEQTFRDLRTHIYGLTGIYFQDNKKYLLEGRLGKRLQIKGMKTFEEYLRFLRSGAEQTGELRYLYEAITINETFFFRNEAQFEAMEQTLVPKLMERNGALGGKKIRVWSSASSSGEEAYTVAMIYLERLRPRYPRLEIEIVGTDINQAVIDAARKGIYRDYAVRNIPKAYAAKYLRSENGRHILSDEVKRLVRFQWINLADQPAMRAMSNFDIIFCCNVLIYFDAPSKTQVISNLYNSLSRGGYLFIGYSESLHGVTSAFKLINFPKTVVYMKE